MLGMTGWLLLMLVTMGVVVGREAGNFSTVGWNEEEWSEEEGGWTGHRDACVEICRCENLAVNCSW